MALKLSLKAGETVFLGSAVVQNGSDTSITLLVKNNTPVLRGRAIMKEEAATTPLRRLYFLIQLAYMFGADKKRMLEISKLIRLSASTHRDMVADLVDAGVAVADGRLYDALRLVGRLLKEDPDRQSADDLGGDDEPE